MTGSELLARSLARQGVDSLFFLMGGPMTPALAACAAEGIRMIDVRHEQAAAMMANAYARVRRRPGVCMAASGPGTANLVGGMAHAFVDGAPVVALGGASPVRQWGTGAFQELDQLALMSPVTKWAARVHTTARIPELVETAFRASISGRPGPVYLDLPADVLYAAVEDGEPLVAASRAWRRVRSQADPASIEAAAALLAVAERPILVTGSGILWSGAEGALQGFAERFGIPVFPTPQGRGALPDDHPLVPTHARSTAFRESDLVLVVGTRMNYMIGHGLPPRFAAEARFIQVDIDPSELDHNRHADVALLGDAGAVLEQLCAASEGLVPAHRYHAWVDHLAGRDAAARVDQESAMADETVPIHPLRLCREVRDFLRPEDVLVVDGQDILTFGRQTIPTFRLGHRLNSGPFGSMGVGLPFGVGAQVASPGTRVIVLHGDGSFGLNAMELDTAFRHRLPVITVISLNGGWTADPDGVKIGRDLGYPRYDEMARALGCHGEYVEQPGEIRPALERAARSGLPAVVNVKTDYRAKSHTTKFADYST